MHASRISCPAAIVCCLIASLSAQEPKPSAPALINAQRIEWLKQARLDLDKQYNGRPENVSLSDVDLVPVAQARIGEAMALLANEPENPVRIQAFQTCSLLVESARVQLWIQKTNRDIVDLGAELGEVLDRLSLVQDSIIRIESSHAAELKDHASQLQDQLAEEKKRAAKMREEMEKKFDALQSELISVSKTARGTIISMSDILFDVGKASLKPDLKTNLAKIAGILTVYKDVRVMVEGHTDSTGSDEFNQKLSEDRASNVMHYLVEQGVAQTRLSATGYGETKPMASNATSEGRQKNRRVDLVVVEKEKEPKSE